MTGLEVSLRDFFEDRVVEGNVGHQLLQTGVLLLQVPEPPGLVDAHATVGFTPAVVGLLGDTNLSAGFSNGNTLVDVDLSFP